MDITDSTTITPDDVASSLVQHIGDITFPDHDATFGVLDDVCIEGNGLVSVVYLNGDGVEQTFHLTITAV